MARRIIEEPDVPPALGAETGQIAKTATLPVSEELAPAKTGKAEKRDLAPFAMPETTRTDWSEFMQVTDLGRRAGADQNDLALVAFKEVVDNAYDVSPKGGVEVVIGSDWFSVHDCGRLGLNEERALRIFDITRPSLSSKRWRRAQRGALGNGTRVIMGVTYVSGGSLTVEADGKGLELVVGSNGRTQVRRRFPSDVSAGTRITVTIGPKIRFAADEMRAFAKRAAAGTGNAFGGTKAVPEWFCPDSLRGLIRDAPGETTVLVFAAAFDLTDDALATIKMAAMRTTTADLLADEHKLAEIITIISSGQKGERKLARMGSNALPGVYAFEGIDIMLGDATVPALVEVWIVGRPVANRQTDGRVMVEAVFANRTPALMGRAKGYVDAKSKDIDIYFGGGLSHLGIPGALKPRQGPCSFDINLAVTCPELPLVSDGKAINLRPFSDAIGAAIRAAIPRAYVPPSGKAEARAAASGAEKLTLKQAVYRVIASAYAEANIAGTGTPPRGLYYRCRDHVMALMGSDEVDYDRFKEFMLDFMEEYPEISSDWAIYFDDRGHIDEADGTEVGLGTLAVKGYIDGFGSRLAQFEPSIGSLSIEHKAPPLVKGNDPSHRISAVLFIEKEGYRRLFEKVQLAKRFDLAIASTKGVSVVALRRLLDRLAEYGIPVFVLHDLDEHGFKIANSLRASTKAYTFENDIELTDIFRLVDAEELGLATEPFKLPTGSPEKLRSRLVGYGATDAEIEMIMSGQRIEIDAMTPPQIIALIERKLTENGVQKIVPREAAMHADYLRAASEQVIARELAPLRAELKARLEVERQRIIDSGALDIGVPIIGERVRARLGANPIQHWTEAVADIALEDQLAPSRDREDDDDDEEDDE